MRRHKELLVWQDAVELVEVVYRITSAFPHDERFGLVSQLRRASISVPSNIAEGVARATLSDYLRFLAIARGSLSELDTQLEIALRLGYLQNGTEVGERIERVFARLNGLIRSIQKKLKGIA